MKVDNFYVDRVQELTERVVSGKVASKEQSPFFVILEHVVLANI